MPNEADIVKYECLKVKFINQGFMHLNSYYNGKVYAGSGKMDDMVTFM